MKVYIEEIEDLSTDDISVYSLVQGMDVYQAEVSLTGIEIASRNMDTGEVTPIEDTNKYKELAGALMLEL